MRVRHFGFLANACKAKNIATIRALLRGSEPPTPSLENKTIATQPHEKEFITLIVSDDVNTLQPSKNLTAKPLVSLEISTDAADKVQVAAFVSPLYNKYQNCMVEEL